MNNPRDLYINALARQLLADLAAAARAGVRDGQHQHLEELPQRVREAVAEEAVKIASSLAPSAEVAESAQRVLT